MKKTCIVPIEELIPILQLQLEQGGKAPLQVTGNSMYPMLCHRRDRVMLEPVSGEVRKGELIFYHRENGAYILHRMIKPVDENTMICCGDNQHEPETVKRSQVIARVAEFTRKGKAYPVSHKGYRLYVWLWTGTFPMRKTLLKLRRWLGRVKNHLRK